jgi:RND family efflux transporter MFP subunit
MNLQSFFRIDEASDRGARARALGIGLGLAIAGTVLASCGPEAPWSDSGEPAKAAARPATKTAMAATPAPAPAKPVAPRPADPTDTIRGVIQSKAEAVIASRITARITAMPFRAGQTFGKGALLASFDCSTTRAQLNAANAVTTAYRKTYETNAELDAYQAVGRNEVEISKANLGKATAEAAAITAQLQDCAVHAPFSGIVVEQIAHAHEVAASGQPLMKIQNSGDLEIQVIVPSGWLTWLEPGAPFTFRIDETGETVKGRVTRLGASVDPVSKTLRVMGSISGAQHIVLPGMSGTAKFEQAAEHGDPA